MLEHKGDTWDPSQGLRAFQGFMGATYVLLHCIHATVSGDAELSPSQTDALLAWGRVRLSGLHHRLKSFNWNGLHKGCLRAISGDAVSILVFPHIASDYLVKDIIDPLIALCSTPRGQELVSEELVSAVEEVWAAAQVAYPDAVDPIRGAHLVWCSGLDRIDSRLADLRVAAIGPGRSQ